MTHKHREAAHGAQLWRKEADRLRQEAEYFCKVAGRRVDEANDADNRADYYESLIYTKACLGTAS